MEREQLERLLGGDDETSSAVRAALRLGASHVVWDGTVPTEPLARVYGRRLKHTRRKGIETSGLERAVQDLAEHGGPVRLGQIRTADGSWVYMLLLDQDGSALVACTGVRQTRTRHLQHAFQLWWWGVGRVQGRSSGFMADRSSVPAGLWVSPERS